MTTQTNPQRNIGAISGDTQDVYPSRRDARPRILARKDPAVYSVWSEDAPISEEQTEFYRQNGFLEFHIDLPGLQDRTIEQEIGRLLKRQRPLDPETIVLEPGSKNLRSIFLLHEASAVFREMLCDPRLVRLARFLLGDAVYIHQSRLNFKPGFSGKEFYWHSDFETWHVEDGMPRMRALSMSISLTPNSDVNGPLMLIPRSHESFVSCVGETPDEHYKQSLRRQEYGTPDERSLHMLVSRGGIVTSTGPVGTVTVFDCNMMHGSNSNITPFPRSNVFVVYNSLTNRLVAPFGGKKPRPEFLATRERVEPIRI